MSARLASALEALAEAIKAEVAEAAAVSQPAPDPLLTIPQACRAMGGISRSTLYGLIRAGHVRTLHVGRRVFVPASALDDYRRTQ